MLPPSSAFADQTVHGRPATTLVPFFSMAFGWPSVAMRLEKIQVSVFFGRVEEEPRAIGGVLVDDVTERDLGLGGAPS